MAALLSRKKRAAGMRKMAHNLTEMPLPDLTAAAAIARYVNDLECESHHQLGHIPSSLFSMNGKKKKQSRRLQSCYTRLSPQMGASFELCTPRHFLIASQIH